MRKIFNDIPIKSGVDFVKHVYRQRTKLADGSESNSLFQATKIANKDSVDNYDFSLFGLLETEHVTFGVVGQAIVRVYA